MGLFASETTALFTLRTKTRHLLRMAKYRKRYPQITRDVCADMLRRNRVANRDKPEVEGKYPRTKRGSLLNLHDRMGFRSESKVHP